MVDNYGCVDKDVSGIYGNRFDSGMVFAFLDLSVSKGNKEADPDIVPLYAGYYFAVVSLEFRNRL